MRYRIGRTQDRDDKHFDAYVDARIDERRESGGWLDTEADDEPDADPKPVKRGER